MIHQFGSEEPRVIYVALRWNDVSRDDRREWNLRRLIALLLSAQAQDRIRVSPDDVRIYNLVGPQPSRGMELLPGEFDEAERTIQSIARFVRRRKRSPTIIVGGTSGSMPMVALILRMIIPRARIELRQHHRARPVNARPLGLVRRLRG